VSDKKAAEVQTGEGQQALGIAVAGLLGQVGCLTVIIIAAALAAGLWIDTQFDTRPVFTILLILGSVPVTIYLMVRLVLGGMARIQPNAGVATGESTQKEKEEA
jgi:hypothetical protein